MTTATCARSELTQQRQALAPLQGGLVEAFAVVGRRSAHTAADHATAAGTEGTGSGTGGKQRCCLYTTSTTTTLLLN